ncbi:MAG: penicillin-binding protein 2 [Chlorobi bacterium]|nr:penicillin-binding protein 2 [Chlorobiota bacterium]
MSKQTRIILLWTFAAALLIIGRLAALQLSDNRYKKFARINSLIKERIPPVRGKIYDRNGKLLVSNQPVYTVYVIPARTRAFDTLKFLSLTGLDRETLEKRLDKARRYSPYKHSPVAEELLMDEIAPLKEVIREFPGFVIKKRYIRKYHTRHAANVLGYLRTVGPDLLKKDPFYEPGDLTGAAGIEKYYEKELRGKKGVRYFNRDKFNRKTTPYLDGAWDTLPEPGKDLTLAIDIDLQAFIDTLMEGKHGAVVAMDPRTGEILSLVSAPSYDPTIFNTPHRRTILKALLSDRLHKPLFDRSILGTYPPGSPFKLINALIDLQEGVVNDHTRHVCMGGFSYGNRFMRCHCGAYGPVSLSYAIPYSCNTFFSKSYLNLLGSAPTPAEGVEKWAQYVKSFGLGDYLGIDLPVGRKGLVPDSSYYRRFFGHNKWRPTYIVSNAIGQGQILVTPVQMANMTAAIANRGSYFTPHLIKSIGRDSLPPRFSERKHTLIDSVHFEPVIKGMHEVYTKGTARWNRVPGIDICGKTGTAENFVRIDGKKVQLPDHSIFVAFAPKDDPRIVVSIFIENGGYGSTLASPIASLIIEKYLTGRITRTDLYEKVTRTRLDDIYKMKADAARPKD